MGTRSRIGVMHGDNLKSVYCHWDGYLDHNGRILLANYDSTKANFLVALGDISSLGSEIGEKHAFSQFDLPADQVEAFKALTEDMCTFYGRDRGEDGTKAKRFADFKDYRANHQYEEYEYCLRTDGHWYVSQYGRPYELLGDAIANEMKERPGWSIPIKAALAMILNACSPR